MKKYAEPALHFTFWLLISALFFLVFRNNADWQAALGHTVWHILLLLVLAYANMHLTINRLFLRSKYVAMTAFSLLLLGSITVLRAQVNLLFPDSGGLEVAHFNSQENAYFAALLTNLGFLAMSTVFQLMKNSFADERQQLQLLHERNTAELQFLKSQINPHFLFNTLNNIYSLAVIRSDRTAPMVLQLAEILRYVIYETHREQLALTQEIKIVQQFVELFKMRCEEPPDLTFTIVGDFGQRQIEPMLLIPLVENCFKHADLLTNPQAYIRIKIYLHQTQLTFTTENTYHPDDRQRDATGGVGLRNIRRRLTLRYSSFHELKIDKTASVFKVTLRIKLA